MVAMERALNSVLIVDDHPLFCDALSMTLRAVAGIEVIDTADRLETAIARLDIAPLPDLIVLDLNLPDVNGLDGLIRLRASAGMVPVVVVSSLADNRVIGACLAAGAAGFRTALMAGLLGGWRMGRGKTSAGLRAW